MALNEQYNQFIGERPSPSNPTVTEYFNKESGAGFSSPEQLFGFASTVSQKPIGSWADLAQPFRVEAPKEIPATALESPKSRFDLDQLLAENQKIRDQLLGSLAPTAEETSLQKRLFELQNEDRATELSAMAGISKAEDKVIPMEFITGQQDKIRRDANLALQTNAFRQQPVLQNLQLLQQNRQSIREKLLTMAQFGQTDINLAMQLRQIASQEQQAAKEFALKYNVESPAYSVDGITVYNTQSGKPYSNEQDFFRDFGFKSWKEVPPNFIQRRFVSDEERIADRNYLFEREQFDFSKYKFNEELGLKRYELEQQMAAIQGMGGLSKEQRTELNRVQDNIRQDKDVKDFIDVRDGYERVQTGAQLNNAQGDLALLFGYMKMLDPNSVVRETEFNNAESAMGYAQKVLNAPSKFFKGNRLTEEGRQFFAGAANKLYQTKEIQHSRAIEFYSNQLQTFGIPKELGIRDYSTSFNGNSNDPLLNQGWETIVGGSPVSEKDLLNAFDTGGLKLDSAGNGKTSFNSEVSKIAEAIGKFESGGRYNAIGKATANGDRAYGKYQVMGNNIPSWTKKALGKSLTPQQFLASPAAQDKVAQYYMGMHYQKYKNIADVASIWFSGRPVSKAGNAKDVNGTTVPNYIKRVTQIYNSLA